MINPFSKFNFLGIINEWEMGINTVKIKRQVLIENQGKLHQLSQERQSWTGTSHLIEHFAEHCYDLRTQLTYTQNLDHSYVLIPKDNSGIWNIGHTLTEFPEHAYFEITENEDLSKKFNDEKEKYLGMWTDSLFLLFDESNELISISIPDDADKKYELMPLNEGMEEIIKRQSMNLTIDEER